MAGSRSSTIDTVRKEPRFNSMSDLLSVAYFFLRVYLDTDGKLGGLKTLRKPEINKCPRIEAKLG